MQIKIKLREISGNNLNIVTYLMIVLGYYVVSLSLFYSFPKYYSPNRIETNEDLGEQAIFNIIYYFINTFGPLCLIYEVDHKKLEQLIFDGISELLRSVNDNQIKVCLISDGLLGQNIQTLELQDLKIEACNVRMEQDDFSLTKSNSQIKSDFESHSYL